MAKKDEDLLYRGLDSSGNDYGSMVGMSDLDKTALDGAKTSWQKAYEAGDQAGMDAAHKQAETIRKKYGYSGGTDGSQYLPQAQFSYETAPQWTSKYKDQIDALTQQILSRAAFSYDPESDPLYQNYREQYTRNGESAMRDTLAQVAARTGGMASSYAGTAAQQSYNGWMEKLQDKIPELQQLAYSMYMDEGDTQRANLEMLKALDEGDFDRYATLLSQYNADRQFAYGQFRDDVSDDQWQTEMERLLDNDKVSQEQWQAEMNRMLQNDEISQSQWQAEMDRMLQNDKISQDQWEREMARLEQNDRVSQSQWQQSFDRDVLESDRDYELRKAAADQDAADTSYARALQRWQLSGTVSAADAAILGVPAGTTTSDYQFALAQLALDNQEQGRKNYESGYEPAVDEGYDGEDTLDDFAPGAVEGLNLGPVSMDFIIQLIDADLVIPKENSSGKYTLKWATGVNEKNYHTKLNQYLSGSDTGSLFW